MESCGVPEGGRPVVDEAELRRLSAKERARLMHMLAAMDMPRLMHGGSHRRRRWFLLATIACCLVLAAWIGVLAVTLSLDEPWFLFWFRVEQAEVVNWAGNPHKPQGLGPDERRVRLVRQHLYVAPARDVGGGADVIGVEVRQYHPAQVGRLIPGLMHRRCDQRRGAGEAGVDEREPVRVVP